jgi:hypothetical protein
VGGTAEDPRSALIERAAAARAKFEANARRLEANRSRLQVTRERLLSGRSRREALHVSAFARLRAQLESLPVIEQAKGILMAQTGCDADEAFDLLRRASQRTNTRVRDLAADIVQRTGSSKSSKRAAS